MSPDKQKLMEDIHSAYHRLWMLAESMEQIPGTSLPMIDEAKQALIHMAGCLEDALAVSEESEIISNYIVQTCSKPGLNPKDIMRNLP